MSYEGGQFLPQKTKKFVALCTQATTAAPADGTVLENTLLSTGTPAWARTSIGLYTLTLAGAFTASKVNVKFTSMAGATAAVLFSWTHTSANVLTVDITDDAGAAADSGDFSIEVEVYND